MNNFFLSSTFSFNVMKLTLMSSSQEKGCWLSAFDLLYIKEDTKVFWPELVLFHFRVFIIMTAFWSTGGSLIIYIPAVKRISMPFF